MKKFKNNKRRLFFGCESIKSRNKGLLDKKRFEQVKEEEIKYLRSLSINKSIKIMEGLLDSGIIDEFKKVQQKLKKMNNERN